LTTFLHKGLKFLSNTESHWTAGTTFSLHLWWHEALLHLQQGNPQAALDLYDNTIGPKTIKNPGSFPLSDASALLMRLHLHGVDVGDRAEMEIILKDYLKYFFKILQVTNLGLIF